MLILGRTSVGRPQQVVASSVPLSSDDGEGLTSSRCTSTAERCRPSEIPGDSSGALVRLGEQVQPADDCLAGRPRAGQAVLGNALVRVPVGQDSMSVVPGHPLGDPGEPVGAVRVEGTIRLADPDGGPAFTGPYSPRIEV